VARILIDSGFSNVAPVLGGFNAWLEAGYPTESNGIGNSNTTGSEENQEIGYYRMTVDQLYPLIEEKDFLLLNVHIPNEGNIPGTDLQIPYDKIADYSEDLPVDKDNPIVVYCKGESMSQTAAQTLIEIGYMDVAILDGGYLAWQEAGYPLTRTP
jgi:rhodanese-related sulfurtransferase